MTATDTMHLGAERAPFVMLPRWLLHHGEISDGAKVLYGMLHDLVAGREGPTRPVTRAQLAACCGVSVDTVDRRLAELTRSGAVEKQAQFDTGQGQLANVYWVRLSTPAASLRPPLDESMDPGRMVAAPPAADLRPGEPHDCADPGRADAAPREEQDQELPPQPPRRAGGPKVDHDDLPPTLPRRPSGSRLRSVGANPRAEAVRAAAAEADEVAARRLADLEAEAAARRAADEAARVEGERLAAEALAVSAVLDDELLEAVVARATDGLAGPLARSPLAVTRAVVAWCRAAAAAYPGSVPEAVVAALAVGLRPAAGSVPPLDLPGPPAGTPDLRARIAGLVRRDAVLAVAEG